jgi:hypothetical protein
MFKVVLIEEKDVLRRGLGGSVGQRFARKAQLLIDGCPAESIEARTTNTISTLRRAILSLSTSPRPQFIPTQLPPGSTNSNLAHALNHIPLPCALASDRSTTLARARARERRYAVLCWVRLRRTTRTCSCLPPRAMRRSPKGALIRSACEVPCC